MSEVYARVYAGDFESVDALREKGLSHQELTPMATVKAGEVHG